jgi:hypothetical protein
MLKRQAVDVNRNPGEKFSHRATRRGFPQMNDVFCNKTSPAWLIVAVFLFSPDEGI